MIFWIFLEIHGYSWKSMEIHGYPGIFINFQKILDITGYLEILIFHGNPCMPELPYMDIQGHTWISMDGTPRKVGRDINI